MNSTGELFAAACSRFASRTALIHGDDRRTYAQLLDRSARLASALGALGLKPNDRLAVFLSDGVESVEVFGAAALAGLTLVPVNGRFKASEATHVVHDSDARALIYTTSLNEHVDGIDGIDGLAFTIAIGSGERLATSHSYEQLIAAARAAPEPAVVTPTDIAVIGYTSGTTGFPKGALCSHRAVTTGARLVPYVQRMATNGFGTFAGSFSFVSAIWGIVYPHLYTGATLRLCDPADVDGWFRFIEHDRSTYTWVPGPLVRTFCAEIAQRPHVLPRLQTVLHTGSKIPREFAAALADVVGSRFVETWGLTETVGPITATTAADFVDCDADDVFASVGRAVPTAAVAVLLPDGSVAGRGAGELVTRGETLFSGYLHRDPQDPDTYCEGWFRTGDVGRIDDAGYVYIDDRRTDMIVSGGMNVYSAEVEMAIATLPGVIECAVFALPDDRWGETVAAAVALAPGAAIDSNNVIDHVRARLASYKKPTRVFFVDALPRNASMKVQKHELKARFS